MSQLNVKGIVENIRARTTVYTPIIEAIANSIDAIDQRGDSSTKGEIVITVSRSNQQPISFDSNALPEISDIMVSDNGVGFNVDNRTSFDTLYSDLKAEKGGKGYGRFMFLKYFTEVRVESVFKDEEGFQSRTFNFGKNKKIIDGEVVAKSLKDETGTHLYLQGIKEKALEKKIETLAKRLVEKLLIYFINDNYTCPKIVLKESNTEVVILNDYLDKENGEIQQVGSQDFKLEKDGFSETFHLKIFKIFYPHNQKSKVSLVAHNREVTDTPLSSYVPEFADDFYEDVKNQDGSAAKKDYIIKTYVSGDYLDSNVSLERGDFKFSDQGSFLCAFSQHEIEREAAAITKKSFHSEVKVRTEKKLSKIKEYINTEAPWHKEYLDDIDVAMMPFNLDNETIETELNKAKFKQEVSIRQQVKSILDNPDSKIDQGVVDLMSTVSKAEISNLAHYVALRKVVLNLFKKSLELDDTDQYSLESAVHDIIFPTKKDSDSVCYSGHNLWIVDERLNFTEYVSSDKPLNGGKSERVDLLVFNKQMVFRGGEEASNPITIFEFKRPQRDDFINPSSKEDPVEQVIRYVNNIKAGKYKTPKGRTISIGANTPFYGFVICDLTPKVKDWLLNTKDFKPMPDEKGWYHWYSNNNLYMEVISWDKVLSDAEMRNKIFFSKLGIN